MGRVNDLINHLSDHYKGNDFYCSSKDHERIVDLWVEADQPPRLGFTVSVNQNGALLKPKRFSGAGSAVSTGLGQEVPDRQRNCEFSIEPAQWTRIK